MTSRTCVHGIVLPSREEPPTMLDPFHPVARVSPSASLSAS